MRRIVVDLIVGILAVIAKVLVDDVGDRIE